MVLEEIKMRMDQPSGKLHRALFATSYKVHPYGRPVIGFKKTVEKFNQKKIVEYYRKWYTPDNMVLIVAGDIQSPKALRAIKNAFKNFASHLKAGSKRLVEPPQKEFRNIILREDVQKAYLNMAFHIPAVTHGDSYALDVLASVLGEGDSSRLFQKVKSEEKLVYSINAYSFTPKDPGIFMIGSVLEGNNVKPALASILREIYRLQQEPPSSQEIRRAKINLESEFIYGKETVQGEARKLGYFETVLGNVAYEQVYLDRINRVTPQDISRVARKYFYPRNLTVGLLLPEKTCPYIVGKSLRKAVFQVEKPPFTALDALNPVTKKYILPNGSTLIVREVHRLPLVAIEVVFLGGVRFEERENNGINNFVAEMLTKGTAKRSALQIAEEIESMAGEISGFSGRNSFGISCTVLSQFFEQGLDLLADVLLNPSFPQDELEKKRADILAAIEQQQDQPFAFALNTFDDVFFQNHPYSMNLLGSKENVGKFTSEDLRDYYFSLACPRNMVITIVGDVEPKPTKKKVETLFQGLSDRAPHYPIVPRELPPTSIREKKISRGKKGQAQVMLGFPGVDVKNPDKYPLKVLNAVLAGQGGRLFSELRDKESLAYLVTSFEWEGLDPGYIAFYLGCTPSKVERAIQGIKRQIQKITEEKVSRKELKRAQNYLLGNFSIEHQTNKSWAKDLAFNERYGLGYGYSRFFLDKILQVSREDVQRIARQYLDLDKYTLVVVLPEETSAIP